mmetsp:Transcript_17870/g.36608  ORF Transcript_17870/g.36608 Transcript_17870/m.36608 type:complete len:358 (-) Transcript_17870:475-1548(-)
MDFERWSWSATVAVTRFRMRKFGCGSPRSSTYTSPLAPPQFVDADTKQCSTTVASSPFVPTTASSSLLETACNEGTTMREGCTHTVWCWWSLGGRAEDAEEALFACAAAAEVLLPLLWLEPCSEVSCAEQSLNNAEGATWKLCWETPAAHASVLLSKLVRGVWQAEVVGNERRNRKSEGAPKASVKHLRSASLCSRSLLAAASEALPPAQCRPPNSHERPVSSGVLCLTGALWCDEPLSLRNLLSPPSSSSPLELTPSSSSPSLPPPSSESEPDPSPGCHPARQTSPSRGVLLAPSTASMCRCCADAPTSPCFFGGTSTHNDGGGSEKRGAPSHAPSVIMPPPCTVSLVAVVGACCR